MLDRKTDRELIIDWSGRLGNPLYLQRVETELRLRGYETRTPTGGIEYLSIPYHEFVSPVAERLFRKSRLHRLLHRA